MPVPLTMMIALPARRGVFRPVDQAAAGRTEQAAALDDGPGRRVLRYRTPVRLATSAMAISTNAAPQAAPEVMWWTALNRATAGLPAVAHPQDEAHAGADADHPQDGRDQARLGEGAGPVAADAGAQGPAPAPRAAPMAASPTSSTRSLPAVGMAWRNWAATKTVATAGRAGGPG